LRIDGSYFVASLSPVVIDDVTYTALYWADGATNAPASGSDIATAEGGLLQWRPVIRRLPGEARAFPESTGGDRATHADPDGWFECISFTDPGTHQLVVTKPGFCDLVIVGGGGGGGRSEGGSGGGGGAGGLVYVKDHWLAEGTHDVVVGTGGRGAYGPSGVEQPKTSTPGAASSFRGYVAPGGGAGGTGWTRGSDGSGGQSGGSGGGGGSGNGPTSNPNPIPGGSVAQVAPEQGMSHAALIRFGSPGYASELATDVYSPLVTAAGDGGSAQLPLWGVGTPEAGVKFDEDSGIPVPGAGFSALRFCVGGAGGPASLSIYPPSQDGAGAAPGLGHGGGGGSGHVSLAGVVFPARGGNGGSGRVYIVHSSGLFSGVDEDETDEVDVPVVIPAPAGVGVGGEESDVVVGDDSWRMHVYDAPGVYTFSVHTFGLFDVFVLGGGGGGAVNLSHLGQGPGGGGGAGSLVLLRGLRLWPGDYSVRVASGGQGGAHLVGDLLGTLDYYFPDSKPNDAHPSSGTTSAFGGDMIVCPGGGSGGTIGNIAWGSGGAGNFAYNGAYDTLPPAPGGCGGGPGVIESVFSSSFPAGYRTVRAQDPGGASAPTHVASGFDSVVRGFAPGLPQPARVMYGGGGSAATAIPESSRSGTWLAALFSLFPGLGVGSRGYPQTTGLSVWPTLSLPQAPGAGGGPLPVSPDTVGTPANLFGRALNQFFYRSAPGGNGLVVIARRLETP